MDYVGWVLVVNGLECILRLGFIGLYIMPLSLMCIGFKFNCIRAFVLRMGKAGVEFGWSSFSDWV